MKNLILFSIIATLFMSTTLLPNRSYRKHYSVFNVNANWRWYFNPPPPTFTEKDTIVTVSATQTFKITYRVPDNLLSSVGTDSADLCIVHFLGNGEATANAYGDGAMNKYGPLDYVHAGWDGGVLLGNGYHYPILIHVAQQPPYGTNPTGFSWGVEALKQINQRFRIRTVSVRGFQKKSIALTGLSAGGGAMKSYLMYDTIFAKQYITSFWDVEGVPPDAEASPFTKLASVARAGVKGFFVEGGNDGRNQTTQKNTMNAAVANSADYYITTSGELMFGHCCWQYAYGGNGTTGTVTTPKVFPGSAFASGIAQNGYQWQYRQTDTTFFTSGANPVAQAGPDQVMFQKTSAILNGTASAGGTYAITGYSWSKISGPGATSIPNPNNAIVAASNLQQSVYVFRLTVTDANGGTATDDVQVTIQGPPIVDAGSNQQVNSSSATVAASSSDEGSVVKNLVQILRAPGQPQYKIGVLGSSTAYGYGVSPDSTIDYILSQRFQTLGLTNVSIVNRAETSTDFWNGLATGTPYPAAGHAPDTSKNLNSLKARGCNIVLWLYTTNTLDYPQITWPVFYDAYKKARDSAVAMGMKFYCITPKTRDPFSPTEEQKLKDFSDSLKTDMPNEVIDVWNGFTIAPNSTATRPEFNLDGVHWNGAGHYQAVKQIIAKNIFKGLYPTSATVTAPSSLTTTVTGMSQGTYTMLISAQDNDSLWNNATMTIIDTSVASQTTNCRTGTPVVRALSLTGTKEIYIPDGGQGIDTLKGPDEIVIPAGSYNLISLGNFNGSNGCKIKIRFAGPVWVKIFRIGEHRNSPATNFYLAGQNLLHIGDSAIYQNGTVAGNPESNGLAISYAKNFKVDSFEVTKTMVGMYIKPIVDPANPLTQNTGWEMDSVDISYFYIHDTKGEGGYIGDTYPNADPYAGNATPARLNHVEIHHGTVDGTDWDGLQLSNARSGAKIHDNHVTNFGRINMGSQQAGIILGGNTTGDVYNNYVGFGTGNGYQNFGYGTINFYNDTAEAVGYDGTVNGQQSFFGTDFISTVETNAHKKVNYHDNVIIHPKTGIGVMRENADNSLTDSIYYTNNQFCFNTTPAVGWEGAGGSTLLMSAATGTSRSGNVTYNCDVNQSPTAKINAGIASITVTLPVTTTLLASVGSFDMDGAINSYLWEKLSGPTGGTITSSGASSTTITSLQQGSYVFKLTVTDDLGATGAANITVNVIQPIIRHLKKFLQNKYKQQ